MRIGVDLHSLQVRACAERGTGRFLRSLVDAVALAAPGVAFVYYAMAGRSLWGLPRAAGDRAVLRTFAATPGDGGTIARALDDHLMRGNPDGIDVLLSPNPLLSLAAGRSVPRRVAVWYDCIPELDPAFHLRDDVARDHYEATHETLATYDSILTLSGHARDDLVRLRGIDPGRVTVIGSGIDPAFRPAADDDERREDADVLESYGLSPGRYVLNVGGMDPRKGAMRLVEVWGLLPESVRATHRLVFAFDADPLYRGDLVQRGRELRLGHDAVLCTGRVPDRTLAALYRNAACMCFPSLYEGFGLPILEAMACGTPVVCGDNSSQPEVANGAALLIDAASPPDIAEAVRSVLADPDVAAAMMAVPGLREAARYSWEATARKAKDVLKGSDSLNAPSAAMPAGATSA